MAVQELRHGDFVLLRNPFLPKGHSFQVRFPNEEAFGIWNWEELWKGCGSHASPGYGS
jgi:hypothetical protein